MSEQIVTLANTGAYAKYFEPEMLSDVGRDVLEKLKQNPALRKKFLAKRLRGIKTLQPELAQLTATDIEYLVGIPQDFLERGVYHFCLEYYSEFNFWVRLIIDNSCTEATFRKMFFGTRKRFLNAFEPKESQLSPCEISRFWEYAGNPSIFEGEDPKQFLQAFEAKKRIGQVALTDYPDTAVYSYAEIVEKEKQQKRAEAEKERQAREQRNRTRLIRRKPKDYRNYAGQKTFMVELEKAVLGETGQAILKQLADDEALSQQFFAESRLRTLDTLRPDLTPQELPAGDMLYLLAVSENQLGKENVTVETPYYMGRWACRLLQIGCAGGSPLQAKFFGKGSDFLTHVGAFEDKLSPADIASFWHYVGEEQIEDGAYLPSLEKLIRQRLNGQMGEITLFSIPKLISNESELQRYVRGGGGQGYVGTDDDLMQWLGSRAIIGIFIVGAAYILADMVGPTGLIRVVGWLLLGLFLYMSVQAYQADQDADANERQEMIDKGLY